MKICPKCGSINGDAFNNCTKCGTPIGSNKHNYNNNNKRPNNTPNNVPNYIPNNRPNNHPQQPKAQPTNNSSISDSTFFKIVIGIVVIGVLIGLTVDFEDTSDYGTNNNYNSYDNNNNSQTMVTCPICNGSGRYSTTDIFRSQMPCTGCLGKGMIPSSQIKSTLDLHAPSTPSAPSSSSGSSSSNVVEYCPHCYGTGACSTCDGDGYYYGDYSSTPIVCPNCLSKYPRDRGKCRWCAGTGRRK